MIACVHALEPLSTVRFVDLSAQAGTMRVLCRLEGISFSVSDTALSRSSILLDVHSFDLEGCADLQCGSQIWEAWAADDPTRINDVKLLHDVVEVGAGCFMMTHAP
jgi:hypothetical protein